MKGAEPTTYADLSACALNYFLIVARNNSCPQSSFRRLFAY